MSIRTVVLCSLFVVGCNTYSKVNIDSGMYSVSGHYVNKDGSFDLGGVPDFKINANLKRDGGKYIFAEGILGKSTGSGDILFGGEREYGPCGSSDFGFNTLIHPVSKTSFVGESDQSVTLCDKNCKCNTTTFRVLIRGKRIK